MIKLMSSDINSFINRIDQLIRTFNVIWNKNNMNKLMQPGTRSKGNIKGAALLAYTYVETLRYIKGLAKSMSPRNIHNQTFTVELYSSKPFSQYKSSYMVFELPKGRRISCLANIYARKIMNLNMDIALTLDTNIYNNIVNWRDIIFFVECKYNTIYSQTYATVVGQRYIVKAGSHWRNVKDALVTAETVSPGVARGNANTMRTYDPYIVTNMRPSSTGFIRLHRILHDVLKNI